MDNISTFNLGLKLVADKLNSFDTQNVHVRKEGNKTTLIASNKGRSRTVYISTHTRKAGTWQTSINYGHASEPKGNETYFWIFVDIEPSNNPQYYIVPEWWIKNNIYEVHQAYLAKHGGQRAINKDSEHHSVALARIKQWHNQWDLLEIV